MIDNTGEDAFVMPDTWRRARHPRRDRPDVPAAPALAEDAAERVRSLVASLRDDIGVILGLPGTASDVAEALIPDALGKAGAPRRAAEAALPRPPTSASRASRRT